MIETAALGNAFFSGNDVATIFIVLTVATCFISIPVAATSIRRGTSFLTTLKWGSVFCLGIGVVVGKLVGTFNSHGFDIPWWVFGLANSVATMLFIVATIGGYALLVRPRSGTGI